jgi:hypothetical protein
MWSRTARLAFLPSVAALLAASSFFGPPHITVSTVSGTPPTPGAVLAITTEHHTEEEWADLSAQVITTRDGKRVEQTLEVTRSSTRGRYGVRKQWETGAPVLLVFTIKQGEHGAHGTASALVKIDAAGKVLGIEKLTERNARGDVYPRGATEKDVVRVLTELHGER